jgi:hypothetical protein
VDVIGHQKKQETPPALLLVIELCRRQQFLRDIRLGQKQKIVRRNAQADVKHGTTTTPRGCFVMQTPRVGVPLT